MCGQLSLTNSFVSWAADVCAVSYVVTIDQSVSERWRRPATCTVASKKISYRNQATETYILLLHACRSTSLHHAPPGPAQLVICACVQVHHKKSHFSNAQTRAIDFLCLMCRPSYSLYIENNERVKWFIYTDEQEKSSWYIFLLGSDDDKQYSASVIYLLPRPNTRGVPWRSHAAHTRSVVQPHFHPIVGPPNYPSHTDLIEGQKGLFCH